MDMDIDMDMDMDAKIQTYWDTEIQRYMHTRPCSEGNHGGDHRRVKEKLRQVHQLQSTGFAFAAIVGDGRVSRRSRWWQKTRDKLVETQLKFVSAVKDLLMRMSFPIFSHPWADKKVTSLNMHSWVLFQNISFPISSSLARKKHPEN